MAVPLMMFFPAWDLAKGHRSFQVEPSSDPAYVRRGWQLSKIGKDCFYDEAGAVAKAKEARAKRIGSLEKQLAKLRALP